MSTWGIVAAVVLVLLNAFFVAAEYSVVSVRRTRIDELVGQGVRSAHIVQRMQRNLEAYMTRFATGCNACKSGIGFCRRTGHCARH